MPLDHIQATQNAHRATHSVSIPCPTSLSRHREHTQNGVKGPVVWQTSQFPPAPMSAQSVTRTAGSGTTASAARRANPCKTAPASCRRPGTRTRQRRGRHSTPGDPALWTRAKQKRKFGENGRLKVRASLSKKKPTSVIFLIFFLKKRIELRISPF